LNFEIPKSRQRKTQRLEELKRIMDFEVECDQWKKIALRKRGNKVG
jgi:hypothetical protein